jgi:hypothetical protein
MHPVGSFARAHTLRVQEALNMQRVGDHVELTEQEAKSANKGTHVLAILAISSAVAALVLGVIWVMWSSAH